MLYLLLMLIKCYGIFVAFIEKVHLLNVVPTIPQELDQDCGDQYIF